MSSMLPANQNPSAQHPESMSGATQHILGIVENVTAPLNQSDTVELAKTGGQTAENIFNILVKSGGRPVAIILATAVLIMSTTLPIWALGQYQKAVSESIRRQETPLIHQQKFIGD
ncbi:hypothetical protein DSM106972_099120 [Dulcicalothrix desertica PCC 7102]|uniref:Uncharacterized protein n=1 Tax=Dulcicalothrix desertica PCC 7102 TaxID=232991 RepID=A0A433UF05_9CYAN|nr:hypothetical protein [Dulcicalothrix desertica]RUS92415.1 hypothetical protein DSM106972_099120 [Dulcicalothrix desertica PCC 7102]TWH62840.1 hypothetical protein CAL7102_00375 [Dulcicalothrix desertica PCC 7102]